MSGHSKWATTKHRKAAVDKVRAKVFAKLIRQLEVAAREGGGDVNDQRHPAHHVREGARRVAAHGHDRAGHQAGHRRARGRALRGGRPTRATRPSGVAIIVDCLTDNRNRTGAEIRNVFTRNGGSMAEPGAVGWQFDRKGVIVLPRVPRRGQDHGGGHRGRRRGPGRRRRPVGGDLRARTTWWRCATRSTRPGMTPESAETGHGAVDHGAGDRGGRGPSGSCGCSRPSTTTTTSRTSGPTSTSPTRSWPPRPPTDRSPTSTVRPAAALARVERMFVLGIDPGLSRCGYGVVPAVRQRPGRHGRRGRHHRARPPAARSASACCSPSSGPWWPSTRPDAVVVERVFFQTNVRTAMATGQAGGVALLVAAEAGCEVAQYSANEVKQAVVGYGGATKDQVQRMVAARARAGRAAPSRPTWPTPWPWRSATSPPSRCGAPSRRPDDREAASVIGWLRGELVVRSRRGRGDRRRGRCRLPRHGVAHRCWPRLGDRGPTVELHVHTHVREDAIVLYGFATTDERRCFEALLGAHGVGPALALAVLCALRPPTWSGRCSTRTSGALCTVPGVGPQDRGPPRARAAVAPRAARVRRRPVSPGGHGGALRSARRGPGRAGRARLRARRDPPAPSRAATTRARWRSCCARPCGSWRGRGERPTRGAGDRPRDRRSPAPARATGTTPLARPGRTRCPTRPSSPTRPGSGPGTSRSSSASPS